MASRYRALRGLSCPKTDAQYKKIQKEGGLSKLSDEDRTSLKPFAEIREGAVFSESAVCSQSIAVFLKDGVIEKEG